jgi:hypothetical protein
MYPCISKHAAYRHIHIPHCAPTPTPDNCSRLPTPDSHSPLVGIAVIASGFYARVARRNVGGKEGHRKQEEPPPAAAATSNFPSSVNFRCASCLVLVSPSRACLQDGHVHIHISRTAEHISLVLSDTRHRMGEVRVASLPCHFHFDVPWQV